MTHLDKRTDPTEAGHARSGRHNLEHVANPLACPRCRPKDYAEHFAQHRSNRQSDAPPTLLRHVRGSVRPCPICQPKQYALIGAKHRAPTIERNPS
jgi:hypothetical protein